MGKITAAEVKALRDLTGAGMMDCKRALGEAEGDLERAVDRLRERGLGKARGKAGRATSEGRIAASVSEDGRQAALIEVNCETDFVARTEDFADLCEDLSRVAREREAAGVEEFLALPLGESSVNDRVLAAIAKLGENIRVQRVARLQAGPKGCIESYIHAGGKIGTLVAVEANDPSVSEVRALAHDLCMHVAAASPVGISREVIEPAIVERERAIFRKQAESEGRPEKVIDKIVEGRLGKFFKEVVLLEQPLVMDPDRTVSKALQAVGAEVTAFERLQLGEARGE